MCMDIKKRETIKAWDHKNENREVPMAFWYPRDNLWQICMNWSYIEPDCSGYCPERVLGPFPIKIWNKQQEEDGKRASLTEKILWAIIHYLFSWNKLPIRAANKKKNLPGTGRTSISKWAIKLSESLHWKASVDD